MISPENIYTSNIIQAEQVTAKNINVYARTYMYATAVNEKRGHEF